VRGCFHWSWTRWTADGDSLIGPESCVLQEVIRVFHLQDTKRTTGQLAATQVHSIIAFSTFLSQSLMELLSLLAFCPIIIRARLPSTASVESCGSCVELRKTFGSMEMSGISNGSTHLGVRSDPKRFVWIGPRTPNPARTAASVRLGRGCAQQGDPIFGPRSNSD
jgi:hypothetical protein